MKNKKAEEIAIKYGLCDCNEAYKSRGLTAPDCPLHAYSVIEAMEEYNNEYGDIIKPDPFTIIMAFLLGISVGFGIYQFILSW